TLCMFYNNSPVFSLPDVSYFKNTFMIDLEIFTLEPAYQSFLQKHCDCDASDLGALFAHFELKKDSLVLVANPERLALFQSYLKYVHHRDYRFRKITDIASSAKKEDELSAEEPPQPSLGVFAIE